MQVVYSVCGGLDVHKASVTVCLSIAKGQGQFQKSSHRFGTTTQELLALADWLSDNRCTHDVAMESTGVYWKPVFNILEGLFEVLVVNAHHIKAVPGRKTDQHDAEWIADLLQHGLLKGSFIPTQQQREWRDLVRYRRSVVEDRTRLLNRLQKILEDANIKLGNVVSDIRGLSARTMLEALISGERDGQILANLALGRLRHKLPELEQALTGRFTQHHAFLLREYLTRLDELDDSLSRVNAQIDIDSRLQALEAQITLLDTIPGVSRRTAQVILAE